MTPLAGRATAPAGRPGWRPAYAFALAALACGILLAGLSAWFLGAVAIAGLSAAAATFNFHVPAALVRLFAIGRTAAKYGERLVGHAAALRDQRHRRRDLFVAMAAAPAVRAAGWQLGDQDRLADYLDDVEDLDNGRLRVDLPVIALAAGFLACLVATLVTVPLAAAPILAALILVIVSARRLARLGADAFDDVRRWRRAGGQRVGAAAAAVVPLQAEGAWPREIEAALAEFARADDRLLALRCASATLDATAAAFGPAAALAVMTTAWLAGQRLEALLAPAFLAFSWFAWAEAGQGPSRILVAALRRRAAAREIGRMVGEVGGADARALVPEKARGAAGPPAVACLRLSSLQRRAPDGRPIGAPLDAAFERGRPTALVGPSGCGKTSLLKQIAGWIGEEGAEGGAFSLPVEERRALAVFCPHDAAVLADTVRANLLAPRASDDD